MKQVITRCVCDICGLPIELNSGIWYFTGGKTVRIKNGVLSKKWEKLDLCNDCFENMGEWLKAKKREKEAMK